MPVMFTFLCRTCGERFEHMKRSHADPDPECPACGAPPEKEFTQVNVKTNRSRAVDLTYRIAEEDYGLTDMRDNLREGDLAVKVPARLTDLQEKASKSFWSQPTGEIMTAARVGAKAARSEGVNPLNLIHNRLKKGEKI